MPSNLLQSTVMTNKLANSIESKTDNFDPTNYNHTNQTNVDASNTIMVATTPTTTTNKHLSHQNTIANSVYGRNSLNKVLLKIVSGNAVIFAQITHVCTIFPQSISHAFHSNFVGKWMG